jgi:hypothetical protein
MCIGINLVLMAGIALVLLVVLHRLARQEGMDSKPPDCSLFTNDESCKSRTTCDWTLKKGSYDEYHCTKKKK